MNHHYVFHSDTHTLPLPSYLAKKIHFHNKNWKVAGSIPDLIIRVFQFLNSSDRSMGLGDQEMSTWGISCEAQAAGAKG